MRSTLAAETDLLLRGAEARAFVQCACLEFTHHAGVHGAPLTDVIDQFTAPPVRERVKAAIAAARTDTSAWAGALTAARPLADAFLFNADRAGTLADLRPRRVPIGTVGAVQSETVTPSAQWAGEETSKTISAMSFDVVSLPGRKVQVQFVVTRELITLMTPGTLDLLQRAASSTLAAAVDTALWDPTSTSIAGTRPASLTAGLTPVTAGADLQSTIGAVLGAVSNGAPKRPVLLVSLATAIRGMALRDLADAGITVLVSPAAGPRVIGVDADGVLLGDGGVEIQMTNQVTLQMDSAPDSPPTAATVVASAWQRNWVVVRVERLINWTKRANAVAYATLT